MDQSAYHEIAGDNRARMRFTPTNYDYRATGLRYRTYATSNRGSLVIELKHAETGAIIWSERVRVRGNLPSA